MPHLELRIVDVDSGDVVSRGQPGELCARGYQAMRGYYRAPEATASTIDLDGWLRTGDICSMDERGYVTVEGRLKEMVLRGGENIFPQEIENVLGRHPDVAAVAVVGLPDERLGERVGAFVIVREGVEVTTESLAAHAAEQLAREKVPEHWQIVDEFPLTPGGKVMKHRLREQYVAAQQDRELYS